MNIDDAMKLADMAPASPAASHALAAEVRHLRHEVERLREDNEYLRSQLENRDDA